MPAFPSENITLPLAAPLIETRLNGLAPQRQGKVRDIFDLGDSLLLVATDRISAFDYVLGSGIPDKGKVLTQLSAFWFERTQPHRPEPPARRCDAEAYPDGLRPACRHPRGPIDAGPQDQSGPDRVRRARLPVGVGLEGIPGVTAAVCGVALPAGLRESDRLPEPIFTPATKADERPRHQHQRGRGRRGSSAQT